jgi:4-aminobutyrate aminotransferase / (S)-3-amino-2-methylpropionate transaminase / 5-aminovalerate transaminase
VIAFDHAFHGRTNLTMALTSKVVPYKRGFGPFTPEAYRAPAPYPARGVSTEEALHGLELLLKQDVDPESVACVVLEPVQGEGGFIVMPDDFVRGVKRLCEEHGILFVDDEVQSGVGRTGSVWAIEHFGVEPDLLVSGKSLGGGLPLAGVTGRAELVDAVPSGGLGGTFGGNPVACAAAIAVLEEVRTSRFRERADEVAATIRARLETLQAQGHKVLEVRGLGPMIAVEFAEQTPDVATAVTNAARDRGLVLLSCGTYGNVVRILVPLSASDDELALGLDRLEESLGDAGAL